MSNFSKVPLAAPVVIFKLTADFKSDENKDKINLGVGAYRQENGQPWVLPVVSKVEKELANDTSLNHEYLPIKGLPAFCDASCRLALGENACVLSENRAAGVQALSGTGALRLAADFLFQFYGGAETTVFHSIPTWGNHLGIYKLAGFTKLTGYTYWNDETKAADITGFIKSLENAPEKSIILFHACAHNPTGADPSVNDWKKLAEICKQKNHFPVFDTAYQGFATGDTEKDAWALRFFMEEGFEMMVCQSYSKNFGLYNERAGNLITIVKDPKTLEACRSQQELIARASYSNPPAHGARIVEKVLNTPELRSEWYENVKTMANRIITMRATLRAKLEELKTPGKWNHITEQIGMFCFTGITPAQCEFLKREKSCYLLSNGRISMAALNTGNMDYFAQSLDEAVRNH